MTIPPDPARRAPEDEHEEVRMPCRHRSQLGSLIVDRWSSVCKLCWTYDDRRLHDTFTVCCYLTEDERRGVAAELLSGLTPPPLSPDEVVVRRESLAVLLIAAQHARDMIPYYSPLRLALINFRAANESLGDLALTAAPDEPGPSDGRGNE